MMRRFCVLAAAMCLSAALVPALPAQAAGPTRALCATAWYTYQYAGIAPGFPTSMPMTKASGLVKQCEQRGLSPQAGELQRLTQKAFDTVAQILEREIARTSIAMNVPPCRAIAAVLKPVGPKGRPLGPGDDVEGYAPDSFLPITKYNWYGGPFRLKYGVGCEAAPYANLWFFSDPYPPASSHPLRFPSDQEVKKDPWPRKPFEGRMSTCITWGPGLKNAGVGGRGLIFGFDWSDANLPEDVRSCYPRAMGTGGLGKYPFKRVAHLPL
jgi:hypothetical protein